MRIIRSLTFLGSALVLLVGLTGIRPGLKLSTDLRAQSLESNSGRVVAFDIAVDCRTAVGGANRGDVIMVSGKVFPFGTLPSGTASFDPAQPFNGVAPIGDWHLRGQHASPMPAALAPLYPLTPLDFVTVYTIFDEGRSALMTEAYNFLPTARYYSSIIGGIGRFRGAAGDDTGVPIGTNATGCPNFHVRINLLSGSGSGGPDK
jgi:hypothetical protein